MQRAKQIVLITLITLVLAEVTLRLTGWLKVYSESIGNGYLTDFDVMPSTWFLGWPPNDTFTPANSDYQYTYHTNHLGLREKDFPDTKSDSVLRILVTGDSFVEGGGAPYDSTWPHQLQACLRAKGYAVEVISGGMSGSDIFYDYIRYREQLKNLQPDIVITAQNSSDYVDYYFRNGLSRFRPDGTVQYNPKPRAEFIYHYLYLYRALQMFQSAPYRGVFISEKEWPAFSQRANLAFLAAAKEYHDTVQANGSRFIHLVHAVPTEIVFSNDVNEVALRDLSSLSQQLTAAGVQSINFTRPILQHYQGQPEEVFTYTHDKHFKPAAYSYMAGLVADSLVARHLLPLPKLPDLP